MEILIGLGFLAMYPAIALLFIHWLSGNSSATK